MSACQQGEIYVSGVLNLLRRIVRNFVTKKVKMIVSNEANCEIERIVITECYERLNEDVSTLEGWRI